MIKGNVKRYFLQVEKKPIPAPVAPVNDNYKHVFTRHRYEKVESVEAEVYGYNIKAERDREIDWRREKARENSRMNWIRKSRKDYTPFPVLDYKKR